MDKPPDIEGIVEFLSVGGRSNPVPTGYRPGHRLYENYISSGEHQYLGHDVVPLGTPTKAIIWLITPHAYPGCVWEGRKIDICEGERVVGTLTITRVLNQVLKGAPEQYLPTWTEPKDEASSIPDLSS